MRLTNILLSLALLQLLACQYVGYIRLENMDCLVGKDIFSLRSNEYPNYENCKQWCDTDRTCTAFAIYQGTYYFKNGDRQNDQYGKSGVILFIQTCNPGYHRSRYSNRCFPCVIGEFSETRDASTACTPCPENTTTAQTASTSSSQCNIPTSYCSRTGLVPTGGHSSYPSPRPSFAYGIPTGYTVRFGCSFDMILVGPSSATCQDDGSWNALPRHCELFCGRGRELNSAGDDCLRCPYGKYKDSENHAEPCTACPPGTSTVILGSTSSSQCESACEPGFLRFFSFPSLGCMPCFIGEYSDTFNARFECTPCPRTTTTAQQGSTSISQCNINEKGRYCTDWEDIYPIGGIRSYPEPRHSFAYGVPTGYTMGFECFSPSQTLVGPSSATCQDGTWSASPGHCE